MEGMEVAKVVVVGLEVELVGSSKGVVVVCLVVFVAIGTDLEMVVLVWVIVLVLVSVGGVDVLDCWEIKCCNVSVMPLCNSRSMYMSLVCACAMSSRHFSKVLIACFGPLFLPFKCCSVRLCKYCSLRWYCKMMGSLELAVLSCPL